MGGEGGGRVGTSGRQRGVKGGGAASPGLKIRIVFLREFDSTVVSSCACMSAIVHASKSHSNHVSVASAFSFQIHNSCNLA